MRIKNKMLKRIVGLFQGKKKKKIYILRLSGVIGAAPGILRKSSGINFDNVRIHVDKAFKDKSIKALVLQINSPGGSPGQSELIYRYIKSLAITRKVPIYSFVEDVAASGGYWLACAGEEIYALDTSIIGSIGVVSASFGFVDLMKKIGVKRRVITQGESKMVWDPFSAEKESDKKIIEEIQKDTHQVFKNIVKTNRAKKLNIAETKLFSGEFWAGVAARKYGLVDGIGDFYTVMREKYGENIEFVYSEKKESMISKMLGLSKHYEIADYIVEKVEEKLAFIRFKTW
jgi:signal peptide peptidase SppA